MAMQPKDVAERLGIAPTTLRLWSIKFSAFLSPAASGAKNENGQPTKRRYSDEDVRILATVKRLVQEEHKTYSEAAEVLSGPDGPVLEPEMPNPPPIGVVAQPQEGLAIVDFSLLILAMDATLTAKDETIAKMQATIDEQRDHIDSLKHHEDATRVLVERFLQRSPERSLWERVLAVLKGT